MTIATGLILHNQFSATERVSPGGNALPSGGHNVEFRDLWRGAANRRISRELRQYDANVSVVRVIGRLTGFQSRWILSDRLARNGKCANKNKAPLQSTAGYWLLPEIHGL